MDDEPKVTIKRPGNLAGDAGQRDPPPVEEEAPKKRVFKVNTSVKRKVNDPTTNLATHPAAVAAQNQPPRAVFDQIKENKRTQQHDKDSGAPAHHRGSHKNAPQPERAQVVAFDAGAVPTKPKRAAVDKEAAADVPKKPSRRKAIKPDSVTPPPEPPRHAPIHLLAPNRRPAETDEDGAGNIITTKHTSIFDETQNYPELLPPLDVNNMNNKQPNINNNTLPSLPSAAWSLGLLSVDGIHAAAAPHEREAWESEAEHVNRDKKDKTKVRPWMLQAPHLPLVKSATNTTADEKKEVVLGDVPLDCMIGRMVVLEDGSVRLLVGHEVLDLYAGVPMTARNELYVSSSQEDASCLYEAFGKLWKRAVAVPDVSKLENVHLQEEGE